jgi:hypothetical protein
MEKMKTDMRKLYTANPGNRIKQKPMFLAVLVPHRDMEGPLKAQSRFLFASGLPGARSFPHVVPLGILSRPLTAAELRSLGAAIRAETLKEGRDGRFCLGKPVLVPCPPFPAFYGPALDLNPPEASPRIPPWKPLRPFPAFALCTSLVTPADEGRLTKAGEPPPLSPSWFRAAALANMAVRPIPAGAGDWSYSLSWKLGLLRWLPSPRSCTRDRKG